MAPKSKPKSMLSSKNDFFEKTLFFQGKISLFGDPVGRSWKQTSIKNRCKKRCGNRKARKLNVDCFSFDLEPSCFSKTKPRRSKIDVKMASKFDHFLKASWNATFSAQEPPRRASAADRRRRWSRTRPGGGGFRRGKLETDSQNLGFGRFALGGFRKGQEDLGPTVWHAVPGWAAD